MFTKQTSLKKFILILILVFGLGAIINIERSNINGTFGDSTPDQTFAPPTEDEQQAGDIVKESLVSPPPTDSSSNNDDVSANVDKKSVDVIVTDAAQYGNTVEVRSFVPNFLQDGTCTITFTRDDQKVVTQTNAYADASSTICINPLINRDEFSFAGNWQLLVEYESTDAYGASTEQEVIIK